MLTKSLIYLINLYQKYLSPHKGYCCAYKVYHNDISCSEFTKNSIKNLGLFQATSSIKQRFQDCKISEKNMKKEKECCENKNFQKFDNGVGCISNACNVGSCLSFLGD